VGVLLAQASRSRTPVDVAVECDWDPAKARTNLAKHGIGFEEASEVFDDPFSRTIPDPRRGWEERRFVTVGQSRRGRLVVVIHADRGDSIRLISARQATPRERRAYEHQEPT
jgi:uncharacterized DUF497 family protein